MYNLKYKDKLKTRNKIMNPWNYLSHEAHSLGWKYCCSFASTWEKEFEGKTDVNFCFKVDDVNMLKVVKFEEERKVDEDSDL